MMLALRASDPQSEGVSVGSVMSSLMRSSLRPSWACRTSLAIVSGFIEIPVPFESIPEQTDFSSCFPLPSLPVRVADLAVCQCLPLSYPCRLVYPVQAGQDRHTAHSPKPVPAQ